MICPTGQLRDHPRPGGVLQPPKGTGSGSNVLTLYLTNITNNVNVTLPPEVATFLQGSLANIRGGSTFVIGRAIDNPFYIIGNITGGSRLVIPKSDVARYPTRSSLWARSPDEAPGNG